MPRMRGASGGRVWKALVVAALVAAGAFVAAADRPIAWVRSGGGGFERELAAGARRGLRLAAVSDGLPCSVSVLQAPATAGGATEYRVVSDRDLAESLDGLVAEGFVPRASTRTFGTRHEVAFERTTPAAPAAAWMLVEFEKLEELGAAVGTAAAQGFRPRLLVRPAFRSWPGLSERGMLLAAKTPQAVALETRVLVSTRRNLDDIAPAVTAATKDGWQVDLLFTSARDGGPKGRRERAAVLLSKAPAAAPTPGVVTIERVSSFGMVGDEVVGAAAWWDEFLFATAERPRHQAWATPVRVGPGDADCGPLGLGFRFDAPRDQIYDVVALLARPVTSGGFELVVVTNQRLGF
jgi:hypothetical protein